MGYYTKTILEDKQALQVISSAVSALAGVHYFAAARELVSESNSSIGKDVSINGLAINQSFQEGYNAALNDLLRLGNLIAADSLPEAPKESITFGAIDKLLAEGTITEKEADELRQSNK